MIDEEPEGPLTEPYWRVPALNHQTAMQFSSRMFAAASALIVALLLSPPGSAVVSSFWVEYWPLASFFRVEQLVAGAQQSLLVTKACEVGLFEALHPSTADGTCVTAPAVAAKIGQDVSVEKLEILLRALGAIGLVHSCTSGGGYKNARHAQVYFGGADSDDYLCGMLRVANDRAVIDALQSDWLSLSQAAPSTAAAMLKSKDTSVWKNFAANTDVYVRVIFKKVVRKILERVPESPLCVVDVGCGSAEFLRVFSAAVPECPDSTANGVMCSSALIGFDLPSVVAQLSTMPTDRKPFKLVAGDVFRNASLVEIGAVVDSACSQDAVVVFVLNSFLQHFNDSVATSIVTGLQRHIRNRSVFVAAAELTVQEGKFNPLVEWTAMSHVFSAVLAAMTDGGRVRTAPEFENLFRSFGASKVSADSLFPMPASLFFGELLSL